MSENPLIESTNKDKERSVSPPKIIEINASQKLADAISGYYTGGRLQASDELHLVLKNNEEVLKLLSEEKIGARVFSSVKNGLPETGAVSYINQTGLDYIPPKGERFYIAHGYKGLTDNPLLKLVNWTPAEKVKIEYALPRGPKVSENSPIDYIGISLYDMSKVEAAITSGIIMQNEPESRSDEFTIQDPENLTGLSEACVTTVIVRFPQGTEITS